MAESDTTSNVKVLRNPTTSNFCLDLNPKNYAPEFQLIVLCLGKSSLAHALSSSVLISHQAVSDLFDSVVDADEHRFKFKFRGSTVRFTKESFISLLKLNSPDQPSSVPNERIVEMFNTMGHEPPLTVVSKFRAATVPCIWNFFFTALYKCLTGVTHGSDQANTQFYKILHHILYDSNVDLGSIIWDEFFKIFKKTTYGVLSCARFWSLITAHIYEEQGLEIPLDEPLFKPPTFIYSVFTAQLEFSFVGYPTVTMLDRIDNRNDSILVSHLEARPNPVPIRDLPHEVTDLIAQPLKKSKSNAKRKQPDSSEIEPAKPSSPISKRVKSITKKKTQTPSKYKKKKSTRVAPPPPPPSDDEHTVSEEVDEHIDTSEHASSPPPKIVTEETQTCSDPQNKETQIDQTEPEPQSTRPSHASDA